MPLDSVQAWRLLRTPFPLTEQCLGAHACEWESIDTGVSGCRMCSHVHRCAYGLCKQVVQTTDALVCEVTGLCVRTSNIVDGAYSDEVISYGCAQSYSGDSARMDLYDEIDMHVNELLLSARAGEVCALERAAYAHKLSNCVQRTANNMLRGEQLDAIGAIQSALRLHEDRKTYQPFDREQRLRLCAACCAQLRSTIPICNKFLKMHIRRSDMRVVVFGLVFLMRSGIYMHDICVLPSIPELMQLLPNESNLQKHFSFKSKNITDIENKFKFHLRHVSRAHMHSMGFHLTR